MTGPWSAAALPKIMAGALQESKGGVLGGGQTEEQQASNRAASPEREKVEQQKPERGLTFELSGHQRHGARPAR
ncbi:MAG: hypothetical protein DDT26_02400 [Dehalococcoidia bacterium]|nr:hypothetical protein [Chloroflexota bacterium]